MDVVFQSFATGLPFLILHFFVTLAMLACGVVLYTLTTPHKDFALVKEGNLAASISLSGANNYVTGNNITVTDGTNFLSGTDIYLTLIITNRGAMSSNFHAGRDL